MKARSASEAKKFTDIPNVGSAVARDFALLGLTRPGELKGKDPFRLYQKLCRASGKRQDPCMLDTMMAAVDFMNGAKAQPWWHYTKERKKRYPGI